MNKQVVIAGVLGAVSAQDCTSAFTIATKAAKVEAEEMKADLESKTAALVASAGSDSTAFDTATAKLATHEAIWTPLDAALTLATSNWKTQSDAKAAATTAETALGTPITDATAALGTATGLVTDQDTLISNQQAIVDKLIAAVTEHTTEEALLQAALTTATNAFTTAEQAETAASNAKVAKEGEKTTATIGEDAVLLAKSSTFDGKTTTYNEKVAAQGTAWTSGYLPVKLILDKATELKAATTLGCTFNDGTAMDCTQATNVNGQVKAMMATATSDESTASGNVTAPKSTFDLAVTATAAAKDELEQSLAAKQVAAANVATIEGAITALGGTLTTATGAKNSATNVKDLATTAHNDVTGQLAQANLDKGRGDTLLASLKSALVPLTDDVVVKAYLKKVQDDKLVVQQAAKTAADLDLADLAVLKGLADDTLTRAATTKTFYAGLLATASDTKTLADGLVTANGLAITACDNDIAALVLKLAVFTAECKEDGYSRAQAAMKALMDKNAANTAAAETVAADYAAKAAFATSGESNTLCAYPAKATDAAQGPRPECKEGFCCGAAQKFLKDGTKLAIETCQTLGQHTYQYYPLLPASAAVEPTPETWRFQCISGAQKLAAAATAALAASYMMA